MKNVVLVILTLTMVMGLCVSSFAQKASNVATVTISAVMHCDACKKKIEGAIPFEKGVKDVRIKFDKQKVEVDYDSTKTNKANILKAFQRIKVEAKL